MKVEIWSDVVCPWCYIGKRRFENALSKFEHRDEVEVTWRSFQLDPDAPKEYPKSINEWLVESKGIRLEQAEAAHNRLTAMGAAEGLDYRFDLVRTGNTFDAHRLIHFAAHHGQQAAMKERLQKAYFTEGQSVADFDTLARLAGEVGLDTAEARKALDDGAYAIEVKADIQRARAVGVTGVPFFVIDDKYAISGAQPAELFERAFEQIWGESAKDPAHPPEIGAGGIIAPSMQTDYQEGLIGDQPFLLRRTTRLATIAAILKELRKRLTLVQKVAKQFRRRVFNGTGHHFVVHFSWGEFHMLETIIPTNIDVGLLILRIALSVVFIAHGWPRLYRNGKFQGPSKLADFLKRANLPAPEVLAWVIALVETVGVLMLLVGLETRILAVVLVIDMLVAITRGHIRLAKSNFSGGETIGWEFEFLLGAGAAVLFFTGAGAISLDHLIGL